VVIGDYLRLTEKGTEGAVSGDALTPREREVVQLVGEGRTSKEVASVLSVSVKTVESHRANIMRKLHLRSITDLVRYAVRNRLVEP
jgi:DNA-binding NarL/FixJ family response regulator